jgi:glutamine amidotransferase
MDRLEATSFRAALDQEVRGREKPILGICLGMQLLADEGTEFGTREGLGYIPGRVEIIPRGADSDLRLPHMGWNDLEIRRACPLLEGLEGDTACYFVHGYHLKTARGGDVSATCEYGGPITATVSAGHVFGAQFHPEKSQAVGLAILGNFAAL